MSNTRNILIKLALRFGFQTSNILRLVIVSSARVWQFFYPKRRSIFSQYPKCHEMSYLVSNWDLTTTCIHVRAGGRQHGWWRFWSGDFSVGRDCTAAASAPSEASLIILQRFIRQGKRTSKTEVIEVLMAWNIESMQESMPYHCQQAVLYYHS